MAEKSRSTRSRSTVTRSTVKSARERVRDAQTFTVELPLVGRVRLPHPEQLAYFGALGALAAVEIIDWPVALVLAAGHALAENHHNKVVEELGEALEDA
jgi:hypothetical protein